MQISRRTLIAALPATALPAAARPSRAGAAGVPPAAAPAPVPAGTPADRATVLANTVAVFAGTDRSNARPETAAKLAAMAATARTRLAAMDAAGSGELFAGLALGTSDTALTSCYQYLYEIALATRVPGGASDLTGDPALRQRVVDGLQWLHDRFFGDQESGYYGNWFNWEIAIPQYATKTLVLLKDTAAASRPELAATYVATMDGYLRNGKDGDVDLDSRFHTGANLADITTDRIMQGALLDDDARITKAVADQSTVLATIDPYALRHGVTDGFYADGSYLQHASVAYTGSYGTGLLTRIVQTVKLLDGTGYPAAVDLVGAARGWVTRSFAPLVFEGWMMEAVKGRAVSRTTTGYADVGAVVESVADLSAHAAGADATALAGYVKFVRQESRAPVDPVSFVSPVSVARYADILADASVPAADLNAPAQHSAFAAMDRVVHRRPGWAFTLARSSTRISGYEYMSGENLMPWFQGAGAHYLYLSGQDQRQAFGVDHFTAVSPYALAGVTAPVETRRTVPELYGTAWYDNPAAGFTSSSESQNTYVYFPLSTNPHSGGACSGAYGTCGMVLSDDAARAAARAGLLPADFVTYRDARATKSWYLFDDEVVVLAAGVGDGAGRAVTTTFDTRIAAPGDAVTATGALRDGTPFTGPGTAPLAWLRYADPGQGTAIGYVLLDGPGPGPGRDRPPRVRVGLESVTRSRRAIRTANPDTAVTKQVFSVGCDQPAGAGPASFAYALVPGATEDALRGYGRPGPAGPRGPLAVLANSTALQAVRHAGLGITAANAFAAGPHRTGGLEVDGPASVLVREHGDGTTTVGVADPTTARDTVTVLLRGRRLRAVSPADGVRVTRSRGATRIEAATRHAYGATLEVTLR
ncbi:putative polysaccharide lyase, family 8 [Actinacidiphila reveromycinica]|uniref:Putative polysaccharide lyase, family 8 n=1 Tax=Actinacidiphila reveromycinica TaxID=659352 RepID=A0A7U3UZD7_9ACTN|nr:polysaccharide lyase family 8 super-sandwich domain-containing protein [Streptomyces sp. SN-593]BBB01505.1 putative polysaccharide lyase, family 8 [Streptomyces sp. SN-593]